MSNDRHIILEDCKFLWTEDKINLALSLFKSGRKPTEVAAAMNEKVIDVGLLLLHLIQEGKLRTERGQKTC